MSNVSKKYCTFTVENHYFGIDVSRVQELMPPQHTRPVPLAPPAVRGLINLRGQIVTAFDLRHALGFLPQDITANSVDVIACIEGERVGLLVDQIGEVIELPPSRCEAPPETVSRSFHRMLESVCQLDDRLLLILDIDRVVAIAGESGSAARPVPALHT